MRISHCSCIFRFPFTRKPPTSSNSCSQFQQIIRPSGTGLPQQTQISGYVSFLQSSDSTVLSAAMFSVSIHINTPPNRKFRSSGGSLLLILFSYSHSASARHPVPAGALPFAKRTPHWARRHAAKRSEGGTSITVPIFLRMHYG